MPVYETSVGFKYVGPEDDRDRRDDGRRGVGRLRLRHAPARARRHLRRPAAARPVHPRARGGPLAGLRGRGPPARHRGAVVLPAHATSTPTRPPTRRSRTGCWSSCGSRRRRRSPGSRSSAPTRSTPTTASSSGSTDGSWLLVRFSGTEPLVRVYAEATSPPTQRDAILDAGQRAGDAARDGLTGQHGRRPANDSTTRALIERATQAGCSGSIAPVPDQMRDAWTADARAELSGPMRTATRRRSRCSGMGGSADRRRPRRGRSGRDRLRVPLVVVRGYELPGVGRCRRRWWSPSSQQRQHRGDADARSATALERKLPGRGDHHRRRRSARSPPRADLPLLLVPQRSACRARRSGYAVTLLAGLLGARRHPGPGRRRRSRRRSPRPRSGRDACGRDVPDRRQPGQAARLVAARPPAGRRGAAASWPPVARRWKTQLNENGKSAAAWEELPEATHNTVVGYPQPETVRDHLYVVFLASAPDHPRNRVRARALDGRAGRRRASPTSASSFDGRGRFAQAMRRDRAGRLRELLPGAALRRRSDADRGLSCIKEAHRRAISIRPTREHRRMVLSVRESGHSTGSGRLM